MRRGHVYAPSGLLALRPEAYGVYVEMAAAPQVDTREGAALVTIRGPLDHHSDGWGYLDSYESILDRVRAALDASPKALVLLVDSPGGVVSGMVDASRAIRAMAREASVPLYAFVEGSAASAAYALASAADRIVVSQTSVVGSIGIIDALLDMSGRNEQHGVRVSLITSGERKADGNPNAPASDAAIVASQKRVDALAAAFFELVAEHRSVSADDVQALEGALVVGAEAVRIGLADEIGTLKDVLAIAVSTTDQPAKPAAIGELAMEDKNEDAARKALQAMVDDEDADEKDRARAAKALKAMDDSDDSDGEEKPAKKGEESAHNHGGGDSKPEKDEEDAKAKASASAATQASSDVQLAERIQVLESQAAARAEADRLREEEATRSSLLAQRPDFAPEALDVLKSAPLAVVEDAVKRWPRGPVRHTSALTTLPVTRGVGQQDGTESRLPPSEANELDIMMGLARPTQAIRHEGTRMRLGVMTPADARAYAEAKAKAKATSSAN